MRAVIVAIVLACAPVSAIAQGSMPVTVDNFPRAETDRYFGAAVKNAGGIAKMNHHREPVQVDKQAVVRSNRDTLYSTVVFDLDAGPVTITLPDAGKRFRSMMALNEDHYVIGNVEYQAGSYTYDRKKVGTRYVFIALRTLVDPNDPKDLALVHALQDATKLDQKDSGKWEVPNWDPASQKKVRDAQLDYVNYSVVVGEKEQSENTVAVRNRENVVVGTKSVEVFVSELLKEIDSKK